MQRPVRINTLYFLFVFSVLAFFTFSVKETPVFFSLYALCQIILEVSVLILLSILGKLFSLRKAYFALLAVFFGALLLHLTNFVLLKLLDSSLLFLCKFFIGQTPIQILRSFQAINMNMSNLLFIAGSVIAIPIFGIILYRITDKIGEKWQVGLSLNKTLYFFLCVFSLLVISDLAYLSHMPYPLYAQYAKILPLKTAFFPPSLPSFILEKSFTPPQDPKNILEQIPSIEKHPNIYIFVIETLRKDYLQKDVAPHLTAFAQNNIDIPFSFSNASSTQHSWFALFHALYPYHWQKIRQEQTQGSTPLRILKKWGYRTHVYSSSDLSYFDMDASLFGKTQDVLCHCEEYGSHRDLSSWEKDFHVIEKIKDKLQTQDHREKNCFIAFLDATHSEYSFPQNPPPPFSPIVEKINYMLLSKDTLEPILNRYRNAIHYIDFLLHSFFSLLKEKKLEEDAIIVITGDHAEEFFEDGAIFHGTHLNAAQTAVPILFHFPKSPLQIQKTLVTHVDIFPTILAFLMQQPSCSFFDGRSAFETSETIDRIAVLQNGIANPEEFILETKNFHLHALLPPPALLYEEKTVKVLRFEKKNSPSIENL